MYDMTVLTTVKILAKATYFHILTNSFFISHYTIWCYVIWATEGIIKCTKSK